MNAAIHRYIDNLTRSVAAPTEPPQMTIPHHLTVSKPTKAEREAVQLLTNKMWKR